MNNRKQKNIHKNQQPRNPQQPKHDILPIPKPVRMEVHLPEIPSEDDFVTIPVDEYTELVSAYAILDAVIRVVKLDSCGSYIKNELLRAVIGMPPEEKHDE